MVSSMTRRTKVLIGVAVVVGLVACGDGVDKAFGTADDNGSDKGFGIGSAAGGDKGQGVDDGGGSDPAFSVGAPKKEGAGGDAGDAGEGGTDARVVGD